MRIPFDRHATVWLVLVAATLFTAALGLERRDEQVFSAALIAIACAKVYLVAFHFMEVRSAPGLLRALVGAYVGAVFVVLETLLLW